MTRHVADGGEFALAVEAARDRDPLPVDRLVDVIGCYGRLPERVVRYALNRMAERDDVRAAIRARRRERIQA